MLKFQLILFFILKGLFFSLFFVIFPSPTFVLFHFESFAKTFYLNRGVSDIPFYEETKPTNVMFFSNPIFSLQRDLAQCIGDKVSRYFDEKYKTKTTCFDSEVGRMDELWKFTCKLEGLEASLKEDSASRSLLNEEVCELLIEKYREWGISIPCGLFFPPKLDIGLDEVFSSSFFVFSLSLSSFTLFLLSSFLIFYFGI